MFLEKIFKIEPDRKYLAQCEWAIAQLGPWIGKSFENDFFISELRHLNVTRSDVILYRITQNTCYPIPKPSNIERDISSNVHNRRILYKHFIDLCLKETNQYIDIVLPICIEDLDPNPHNFPIFSFQKDRLSNSILIPDPDFFYFSFYNNPIPEDKTLFEDKFNRAIFVGATTGGGNITKQMICDRMVPRINSAIYFKNSSCVDFYIPKIVQCSNAEAERFIKSLGIWTTYNIKLEDQYSHRYIISIDGNGAACSRVCIALKSNSVLMKYNSCSVLYYFAYMQPWVHYIPISSDDDVERIIRASDDTLFFKNIAENGKKFFHENLEMDAVLYYFRTLIFNYHDLVAPKLDNLNDTNFL